MKITSHNQDFVWIIVFSPPGGRTQPDRTTSTDLISHAEAVAIVNTAAGNKFVLVLLWAESIKSVRTG